jgi:hypothetical protein
MTLAPIALFVYNRPWHTMMTVEALKKNDLAAKSDLIIFSDAPKNVTAHNQIVEVREYLKKIEGFRSLEIIERVQNFGLSNSIIHGVTTIVNKHGKIIVLEDDMITSPFFLKYMNEALDFYQNEEKVISIHGYIYPVSVPLPQTFFVQGADCWGWATWKRGWDLFEPDGKSLLEKLLHLKLTKRFDINGSYNYTQMLKDQIDKKNDSWAIRWYASAFLHAKLTLYPGRSLIRNIGNDNSGTHCEDTSAFDTEVSDTRIEISNIPVVESITALKAIENHFKSLKQSAARRLLNKLLQL